MFELMKNAKKTLVDFGGNKAFMILGFERLRSLTAVVSEEAPMIQAADLFLRSIALYANHAAAGSEPDEELIELADYWCPTTFSSDPRLGDFVISPQFIPRLGRPGWEPENGAGYFNLTPRAVGGSVSSPPTGTCTFLAQDEALAHRSKLDRLGQVLERMAEGGRFELPRASRPGGFQVPEIMGVIGLNRASLVAISGPSAILVLPL
jgi:hypothetical protein